jgi:hypothetical protein
VAALLGPELGWSAEQARREAEAYRALVAREHAAPELPVAP